MTRILAALSIIVSIGGGSSFALAQNDGETRAAASRAVIQSFAKDLKGELQQAIKASGPPAAIEVCREAAPAIAAERAGQSGWEVGRTSLKLRNPLNAPDPWETKVLNDFESRKAKGEAPEALERYEFIESDGRSLFRYMKAIPTGKVCLACHGTALSPAVEAALASFYPEDRATGFALGDLRGAFTITQPVR